MTAVELSTSKHRNLHVHLLRVSGGGVLRGSEKDGDGLGLAPLPPSCETGVNRGTVIRRATGTGTSAPVFASAAMDIWERGTRQMEPFRNGGRVKWRHFRCGNDGIGI